MDTAGSKARSSFASLGCFLCLPPYLPEKRGVLWWNRPKVAFLVDGRTKKDKSQEQRGKGEL